MDRGEYQGLSQPEARAVYFELLFQSAPSDVLKDLVEYVQHTSMSLTENGFDPEEAARTAADGVFSSVSTYLHGCISTRPIDKLHEVDSLVRELYEIDERDFPLDHENALVASFYTTLQSHLPRRMAGVDRYDAFGGYN